MENLKDKNRILLRIEQMTEAPWDWIPNQDCERTQAFFKFLGKESIKAEEIEQIIKMKLDVELREFIESPVVTTFEVYSEYFVWRDFENNRYAGLRKSERSGYYNKKATSRDKGSLMDKLFDRQAVRKQHERYK